MVIAQQLHQEMRLAPLEVIQSAEQQRMEIMTLEWLIQLLQQAQQADLDMHLAIPPDL